MTFTCTIRLFLITIVISFLQACERPPQYHQLSGYTMGTSYQITFESDGIDIKRLHQAIENRLIKINQLMSTYIDDSELSQFNSSQTTKCIKISPETYFVIQSAQKVYQQTQGKFDVTVAPLIEAWGFDKKDTQEQIPSQDQIDQLRATIGGTSFELKEGCVQKTFPQLTINLSAIAKGYGVDEIAQILTDQGIQNYLVEIGGEIAVSGNNPRNKPWRIAIESATSEMRSIQRTITPLNLGVATSGDYRNYFEKNGKRYSHTIDPTTGYPITHKLASVTVLHQSTMLADAYSTAMMVMGPEESLAFANQLKLPALLLVKQGNGFVEIASDAFKPYIK